MERCNTSLGGNESVKLLWHDVHDINHWSTRILFTQKLLVRLYRSVYAFPACDFPCVESDLYTLCPCWLAISALYPLTCHRLSLCDAMFLLQRGLLLILHWSNSLKAVYFPSLANLNALLDQYIHIFCTLKEIIACNISNMVQCLCFFPLPQCWRAVNTNFSWLHIHLQTGCVHLNPQLCQWWCVHGSVG